MAFRVLRFLSNFWASASSFLLGIWRRIAYGAVLRDTEQAFNRRPLPPKAAREAKKAFIDSLQATAVEALASRYNGNKTCKVFRRDNGSFNVCFFVEFLECKTRWVVRIPIEAVVHEPWTKLQSEVATMRHIKRHTSIPVPTVHAYGKGEVLTNNKRTSQMFLISDMMPGHLLVTNHFTESDGATRRRFFLQLFDYLSQLRGLEFPKIGSLMPADSHEVAVDGLISFSTNDLGLRLPAFTTARAYMQSQFDLLARYTANPVGDYFESDTRYELFALHSTRQHFDRFILDDFDKGPFVLNHSDLHLRNILVDDKLYIHGIIDWEFANVVPIQLAIPPLWAVNQEPGLGFLSFYFSRELFSAAREDDRYKKLEKDWLTKAADESFHLARLIRYPADLTELFSSYFSAKQSIGDLDLAEEIFFHQWPQLADEARERAARNADWTQYLKENDLYGE